MYSTVFSQLEVVQHWPARPCPDLKLLALSGFYPRTWLLSLTCLRSSPFLLAPRTIPPPREILQDVNRHQKLPFGGFLEMTECPFMASALGQTGQSRGTLWAQVTLSSWLLLTWAACFGFWCPECDVSGAQALDGHTLGTCDFCPVGEGQNRIIITEFRARIPSARI